MARFTRIQVALKMKETGLVAVFYHPDLEVCKKVLKACYDGGLRVFEFTNRGDFAHEIFGELEKYAKQHAGGLILGVGSVVDAPTAALYIQHGASFIVSPVLNEDMAKICNRRKIMWSPGCGSVSEISKAEELGAEVVKIFPASQVGGPDFIKAVKGPLPWASIMPTGGVEADRDNLMAWFAAGAHCVGMGSKLITSNFISNNDYEGLKNKVQETMSLVESVRP